MLVIGKQKIKYYEYYFDIMPEDGDKFIDATNKNWLLGCLNEEVLFEEDLTFKDFYNHLLSKKDIVNELFRSSTNGVKIEEFSEEIISPYIKDKDDDMDRVQVSWNIETGHDKLHIRNEFLGVKKGTSGNIENGVATTYSIDFTPLNKYGHLPFCVNTNFIIVDYKRKGPNRQILKANKDFTLFEVIDAVLQTITYNGTIEARNKSFEELVKRLEQSEKDIKAGRVISMEDLKKEMRFWDSDGDVKDVQKD